MTENIPNARHFQKLWAVLRLTRDAMQRAMEDELRDLRLTIPKIEIIFAIKLSTRPATASEISRQLFRQRHTVKETLDRMEKQGLIRRVNDLPRKNSYRVVLTEEGEEVFHQALRLKVIPSVASCISPSETDNLTAQLEKVRNAALSAITTMSPRDIEDAKSRLTTWMKIAPSKE